MRQVWKFPLMWVAVPQTVDMPVGAKIVCVRDQHTLAVMWAEVEVPEDTQPPVERRSFVIVGTGQPIPDGHDVYRGTVCQGSFVFHIFEAPTRH